MYDENLDEVRYTAIIGVVLIILLPLICLIFFFLELDNAISATGIIINGVLSILLASLYFKQAKISEDQKETQEILAHLEYSSNIVMDKWKIEQNEILFQISNIGNGYATDLRYILVCDPVSNSSDGDSEFRKWFLNLSVDDFDTVPLRRDEKDRRSRNILKPDETAQFKNNAILPTETSNNIIKNVRFEHFISEEKHRSENNDRIRMAVILEYDDQFRDDSSTTLWNMEVYLEEVDSLEDLFESRSMSSISSKESIYPMNLENQEKVLRKQGRI